MKIIKPLTHTLLVALALSLIGACGPAKTETQTKNEEEDKLEWEKRPDGSFVAIDINDENYGHGAKCWPKGNGFTCIVAQQDLISSPPGPIVDIAVDVTEDSPGPYNITVSRFDFPELPQKLFYPASPDLPYELYYFCFSGGSSTVTEAIRFRKELVKNNTFIYSSEDGHPWDESFVNDFTASNAPAVPAPYFDCITISNYLSNSSLKGLLLSDISASMARAD